MAILYEVILNNPTNDESVSPEVSASEWLTSLDNYFTNKAEFWRNQISVGSGSQFYISMIFNSEENLNQFISEHKLADSGLIASMSSWCATNNVTITEKVYNLSESTSTFDKLLPV
jgi:hypothetical protein